MEMLFGPYGAKLLELAQHYPSTAMGIVLAVFAAIDWLINPDGSPGDAGLADSSMQAMGTAANKKPTREGINERMAWPIAR
jgi:hypothetical protein